ncbi:MAG: DUF3253 domain-containing protein [Pseudomonadota bacterium]
MTHAEIERQILALLADRGPGKTICPSEAARRLATDWRPLMSAVRAVAARMQDEGRLSVLQRGAPVDPGTARGPIRLALP